MKNQSSIYNTKYVTEPLKVHVITKGYIPAISDNTIVVQLFKAKQFFLWDECSS